MKQKLPIIGQWYQDRESSEKFEVVAIDDDGNIEVQFLEGEIEEIDADSWFERPLSTIAEPEDWSAPFEIAAEEKDYYDESMATDDWPSSFDEYEEENIDSSIDYF